MSIARPVVYDGGLQRQMNIGDTFSQMEPPIPATDTTNTTLALTPAMLLASTAYARNPAGVSTDTFPDAASLIAAMSQGFGTVGIQPGTTFRWSLINLSANIITTAVTANTGATLVRGSVAAGAAGSAAGTKTFVINITNGTPAMIVTGLSAVNTSAVVSGLTVAQCAALSVGMIVTNAVSGQQGQTIIAINAAAGQVTLSGNANATASALTYNFSPTYIVTGLSL